MDFEDYAKVPEGQLRGPELLKTLPSQTKLFDNLSPASSLCSEISGPFSDVVYTIEVESKKKAKELYGKDLYTAFSFSPEFRTALEEVKKELIAENPELLKTDSMVGENLEKVKSSLRIFVSKDFKPKPLNFKFLQFPNIDYEMEKVEEEEVDEKKKEKDGGKDKKKKKAVKVWQEDDDTVFDTMSGYWRLLSVFDEFRISPPWYDAYAEGKEHWLQTKPIPPDVLENSRKKCLNWLSKYHNK